MLILLISIMILLINMNQSIDTNLNSTWTEWKQKYNKTYKLFKHDSRHMSILDEEKLRFQIFNENLLKIRRHNSNKTSKYLLDINEYSDLNTDELNKRFHTKIDVLKLKQFNTLSNETISNKSIVIADKINWVKKGYVAKIANQGQCGACYTFATVIKII